MTWPGS